MASSGFPAHQEAAATPAIHEDHEAQRGTAPQGPRLPATTTARRLTRRSPAFATGYGEATSRDQPTPPSRLRTMLRRVTGYVAQAENGNSGIPHPTKATASHHPSTSLRPGKGHKTHEERSFWGGLRSSALGVRCSEFDAWELSPAPRRTASEGHRNQGGRAWGRRTWEVGVPPSQPSLLRRSRSDVGRWWVRRLMGAFLPTATATGILTAERTLAT
jgi:hypothetical protein